MRFYTKLRLQLFYWRLARLIDKLPEVFGTQNNKSFNFILIEKSTPSSCDEFYKKNLI